MRIDYQALPAVVDAGDAVKAGAPVIHHGAMNNISFTLPLGNAEAVEPAFATAHHVTKLELFNNRLNAMTMEPRGGIGDHDEGSSRDTLYTSTQNVQRIRHRLSHQILHVPEGQIRAVADYERKALATIWHGPERRTRRFGSSRTICCI